ncbi:MAG: response regulator [Candidatus Omnitrophota bacterium]
MTERKRNKRILIVDDDADTRDSLGLVLTEENFIVEKASNGKEALKMVERNKPDLILLDCVMPVMDGFETYCRLKDSPGTRNIPVIFCTATHIKEAAEGRIQVDDYIEKPFSLQKLCRKINKILEKKESA